MVLSNQPVKVSLELATDHQEFAKDDPHLGDGYYLVPAIDLCAESNEYPEPGPLVWLPSEGCYAMWDRDHWELLLLTSDWQGIVDDPKAHLDYSAAATLTYLNPIGRFPHEAPETFGPRTDLVVLTRAAESGKAEAMFWLGHRFGSDAAHEQERWWREAADLGHISATSCLARVLTSVGRGSEAEPLLRSAVELGGTGALQELGTFLRSEGRLGEAEDAFIGAIERADLVDPIPDTYSMVYLADVLQETDRADEADQWYLRAASLRNALAMSRLASAARAAGRNGEADEWERLTEIRDPLVQRRAMLPRAPRSE